MRPRSIATLVVACALIIPVAAAAQERIVVEGKVVADDTGKPLPGVHIMLSQDQTSSRTDKAGRFEINLPSNQPSFMVAKPGYVRTPTRVTKSQRNLVVRMPRAGAIAVHVFDTQGEPSRATVRYSGRGPNWSGSGSSGTDDRGQVRFGNLRPGRYELSIGSTSVAVKLPPRDLSDAEVIRFREELERRSAALRADAGQSSSAVEVRAGKETEIYLVDASRRGIDSTVDLRGAPKGTAGVQGQVVDATGVPVPGAAVIIFRGLDNARAVSDASGAFKIGSLPSGTVRVTASKAGFAMTESDRISPGVSISLDEGEQRTGVVLRMASASEITGMVLDEFGDPVERAMVHLLRVNKDDDGTERLVRAGLTQSDYRGRYRLPSVAPGAYSVLTLGDITLQGETYLFYPGVVVQERAQILEVSPGRDLTGIDFRLNPELGQQITGTVVESTGQPRPGGSVMLTGNDVKGVPIEQRSSRISRTGAFVFLNVAPGRYTVSVLAQPTSPLPRVVDGKVLRDPAISSESGAAQIQVGDTPPDHVVLRTAPGASPTPRPRP